jgi:hypothetical protein
LATPALVAAAVFVRRGSVRAELVWLGLLDYALYNYAFYLFGAAFNAAFLPYVAIVTASTFALVLGVASLDVHEVARQVGHLWATLGAGCLGAVWAPLWPTAITRP